MEKITVEGKNKLEEELKRLERVERPILAKKLKKAISFGDLSENAEYSEAKDDQARMEKRISQIRSTLRTAEIVGSASNTQTETISIGATFEVSDKQTGTVKTFSIVGKEEANPIQGKISFDSPLGAAFLNKKKGDMVTIITPGGEKLYTIQKII